MHLETRDVQVDALWVWPWLRWGQWPCTESSLQARQTPASQDYPSGLRLEMLEGLTGPVEPQRRLRTAGWDA